jgi:hypothetical protein
MLRATYLIVGVLSLLSAGWMILAPASWYTSFPGDVSHTGPLNTHFIRDLGLALAIVASVLLWSARYPRRSRAAHMIVTVYFAGHALIHLVGILNGDLPAEHWKDDALGVFIPALVLVVFAIPLIWRRLAPSR